MSDSFLCRKTGLCRGGFTLVEMLVAMVLTLILVYALAEFYAYVGDTVKDGRAMIELSGQLRGVVQRLKNDLDHITVQVKPWTNDGGASGYFEIYEGPASDADANGNSAYDVDANGPDPVLFRQANATTLLGDADDILAMTIRASGEPLTGRYNNTIVSAPFAEVIWWVGFDDLNNNAAWDPGEPRRIYRRQLLIRPDVGQIGGMYSVPGSALSDLIKFWQANDISAGIRWKYDGTNVQYWIQANSLADLSRREHRFAHMPVSIAPGPGGVLVDSNFPHRLLLSPWPPTPTGTFTDEAPPNATLDPLLVLQGNYLGEDVVLSNVLAFDVRVYDPYAVVRSDFAVLTSAINALVPPDPGYNVAVQAAFSGNNPYPALGSGAFVDLGYGYNLERMNGYQEGSRIHTMPAVADRLFMVPPYPQPGPRPPYPTNYSHFGHYSTPFDFNRYFFLRAFNSGNALARTYDTWSLSYERDGIDQNRNGLVDEGTNGLDDDGANGVDDVFERETSPPFAHPLRGIEVKIRIYEPGTRQMRQATVGADFVPE